MSFTGGGCGHGMGCECQEDIVPKKIDLTKKTARRAAQLETKQSISITGLWLRRRGDKAEVLVERGGKWYLCAAEYLDNNFSHIIEPLGIERAKLDDFK